MLTLQLTLGNGQVRVLANELQSHSFSIHDLDNTDLKNFVNDPKPYGGKLFQALFKDGSEAHKAFDDLSKQTERTIVLVLESPDLDGIAWEYAYHDNAYVVEDFAFIRALPEKERPHSNGRLSKSIERVPLLFIPANPLVDLSGEPMHELDIESEWREMAQYITKSNAPFDLIELRPATPAALQSIMARFQNGMIAHFSGHGAATKDGAFLLFENENGSSNPLEAREFVREVKDQAWIGFLSACQSAVAERTAFGNLARELVKAGVPFALGMQFNLPDLFAPNISGQFYNYLSQGHAVPEAARQARRAVKRENEFYVGMIALYAAHPNESGKMEWSSSGARTLSAFAEADVSDLPTPSGFIGRQRELMNIGTSLLGKKKPNTVTLHGAGGIGKTALMRQTLLRFAPSFESTLAIALDPLPSLESVLGRLERFLNLPSPCSNETKERERIVRERLTRKRTLLGLDNFETLNYALNEKGSDEEKTSKSLHAFFKYLAANGVTLCVTSREVANLPGETIEDIQGLTNENGGRLFQGNVVRQKDKIHIDKTQQVSEMVGGHPLALRLLASAFDDQIGKSLDQYIEDLQSFLPKARDKWTEEGRHESLRASFDFTMNNLAKRDEGRKLQIAISRLSMFVAFFVNFTAAPVLENHYPDSEKGEKLSDMVPDTNKTLHALWERGLLERAIIFLELEYKNYYLYRLHPALGYFARERLTDFETVKENYWNSISNLTNFAVEQISKSQFWAQIALLAVPDLMIVAELKNDEDAAIMQNNLFNILYQFGLYDEALRLLRKSLEKYRSLNDSLGKSSALHNMAMVQAKRGELDDALAHYQQALSISEELGNLQGKLATLTMMASIFVTRGQLDRAIQFYQQALEASEEFGDPDYKAVIIGEMASIYISRGHYEDGLKLNQEKLAIVRSSGNKREEAIAIACIAVIETARRNFEKALSLYKEAVEINKQLNNINELSKNFNQMGGIYAIYGDFDQAMKFYQQAIKIFESLGHLNDKATVLHNMAEILVMRNDFDKAMKFYQQSLEIQEFLGSVQGKASTLRSMGVLLFRNKQYPEALRYLVEALTIFENLGLSPNVQSVVDSLVQFRQALGANSFDSLWHDERQQPLPTWLSQASQQQQGMTVEQFIAGAIQSTKDKHPEKEQYFKEAQRLIIDSNTPKAFQSLGKVLQRIMAGEKNVDLSLLTDELREMVEKALEG